MPTKKDRTEYMKDYHAEHPQEGAAYVVKQRQKDSVCLFHLKRERLYGYELPAEVAADTDRVERMRKVMEAEIAAPVEVEVKEV